MSENVFIPKMNQSAPPKQEQVLEVESTGANDAGGTMLRVAQYAVILLAGSIAVFFTPHLWASLGFDKTILAFGLAIVSVISLSLLALRRAKVATVLPISLGIFWVLVMAAMVSGLHSGDIQDAMRGSVFDPQTVGFLAILALTMTISLSLQNAKVMSMKALAFFGLTAIVVLLYNVLRIIFGPAFLGFDSFGAVTVSPIGSFNDLAIFASLVILLGLVTLMQLPLKTWLQSIVAGMIVLALFLLGVINFFNIWIIVGFFSLLLFVFLLSRDTLFNGAKTAVQSSRILLATTAIVCIVSAVFIVAGDYVGNKIGQMTSVNYVEVRPSAEATIGIARAVYSDNLFMGVGPNRFADAWRQHKDPAINETIFWDTDFNAGSGFIPTLFINTGVVGMTLLVLFHLVFLYTGYRMLLRTTQHDPYWYYFGVFSFTAACFLWLMSYIYVPGSAILLLAALFTGFTYVAAGALLPMMVKTVPLAANRRRGFFLMAAIILIITVSIGSLFSVGKQYVAQANFTKARVQSESVAVFDQAALAAFTLYDDPRFQSARAQVQMANLSSLLAVEQPSEEQQQQFLEVAEQALLHAEQAVSADLSDPDHHALLAGVYSNLALAGIDGAAARSEAALAEAERLDPLNPGYHLIAAQIAARTGDVATARTEIAAALELKRNFTEALYLSAQLDIAEGKADSAIATTRTIIRLEPNNPTRYFQLGVLLSANDQVDEAIVAYNEALRRDPQYANARYLMALALLNKNEQAVALEQLRLVQQTNQENQQLQLLIEQVESGEYQIPEVPSIEAPVSENAPTEGFEDAVITNSDVETDLVTPVNTITNSEGAEGEPVVDETVDAAESAVEPLPETVETE